MENKEYEKQHEKTAIKLRVIGIILLCIGLGCVVTGMVDLFRSAGTFDEPKLFWLNFVGFPFIHTLCPKTQKSPKTIKIT